MAEWESTVSTEPFKERVFVFNYLKPRPGCNLAIEKTSFSCLIYSEEFWTLRYQEELTTESATQPPSSPSGETLNSNARSLQSLVPGPESRRTGLGRPLLVPRESPGWPSLLPMALGSCSRAGRQ